MTRYTHQPHAPQRNPCYGQPGWHGVARPAPPNALHGADVRIISALHSPQRASTAPPARASPYMRQQTKDLRETRETCKAAQQSHGAGRTHREQGPCSCWEEALGGGERTREGNGTKLSENSGGVKRLTTASVPTNSPCPCLRRWPTWPGSRQTLTVGIRQPWSGQRI